jgi:hypothetical protein
LHAAFCVFAAVVLHAQLRNLDAPRWLIVSNVLWSLGILGSTVATRQHVALDAIAGAALGGAVALAYARAIAKP